MRNLYLLCALLIFVATTQMVQAQTSESFRSFPNVKNLTQIQPEANVAYEIFSRNNSEVTLSDIREKLQSGGNLYEMDKGTSVLLLEDVEPVILLKNPDEKFSAFYFCRFVPVCAELPQIPNK